MDNRNTIQGDRQRELFEALRDAQTLITLRLRGATERFERLTLITGVRQDKQTPELLVDSPRGFEHASAALAPWKIIFTFRGTDQLEYTFETRGGRIEGKDLVLPFPEVVERLQRRRHFRVDAPPGTRLTFTRKAQPHSMEVINVSLGGALGVIIRGNKTTDGSPGFRMNQRLSRITLTCPNSDQAPDTITIPKAVVRRVERDQASQRHRYGIEFDGTTPDQLRKLTEFIYRIQRELLRRR